MTCVNCGANLETTATTCTVCGAPVAGRNDPAGRPAWEGEGAWDAGRHGAAPGAGAWGPGGGAAGTYGAGQSAWGAPQPHPSGLSGDIRGWGVGAHASSYLALIGLPIVGPLLVWLIKRDHPFIDHHGKEALNFNLSVTVYGLVLGVAIFPVALLTLGLGLVPLVILGLVLAIVWLVLPVVACVRASNGEGYRYPMTIRFVK